MLQNYVGPARQKNDRSRILAEFMLEYRAASVLGLKHKQLTKMPKPVDTIKGKTLALLFCLLIHLLSCEQSKGVSCHEWYQPAKTFCHLFDISDHRE